MRPGRLLEPLLPRPETGGRLPRAAIGVALGLVVLGALALVVGQQVFGLGRAAPSDGDVTGSAAGRVRGTEGSYAFTLTQPQDRDLPVTWDPCTVIPVEVDDRLAPPGSARVLDEALDEVARVSGLRFRIVGRTTRQPPRPGRTGDVPRRQPALVSWTTPEQMPELRGDVAGLGGSTARPDRRTRKLEYVTGSVALDAPQLTEVMTRPGGVDRTRAIVIHELAHLVGLDHVDDPDELMYADTIGRIDLGPGDREGLAALGDGPCF